MEPQTQSWPLSSLSRMNEFTLVEHELDNTDVSRLDVSYSPYVATRLDLTLCSKANACTP